MKPGDLLRVSSHPVTIFTLKGRLEEVRPGWVRLYSLIFLDSQKYTYLASPLAVNDGELVIFLADDSDYVQVMTQLGVFWCERDDLEKEEKNT